MSNELNHLSNATQKELQSLRENLKSYGKVCVAFSGGVDSSLVAAIAHEQLGPGAIAITGVSEALSPHLLAEARNQAAWIGIRHVECLTQELKNPAYSLNPKNRCYACKQELHRHISTIAQAANGSQVLDGVNHDDLSDYRPGIKAGKEAGVSSPLAELKISKIRVREISKELGLPWWNKPAQPCLASRFPYGERISRESLQKVDKAEQWLRGKGFLEVRVRYYGLAAKIEVPKHQIDELLINLKPKEIRDYFFSIGFNSVTLDSEGLISGKLNQKSLSNKNLII